MRAEVGARYMCVKPPRAELEEEKNSHKVLSQHFFGGSRYVGCSFFRFFCVGD